MPQTSLVSYCIIESESVIGCLLCILIICMSKHSQVMCCAAVGWRHHCYTDHDTHRTSLSISLYTPLCIYHLATWCFSVPNLDCTLLHAKVLAINYATLYHFSLLITDNLVITHPLYICNVERLMSNCACCLIKLYTLPPLQLELLR